MAVGSNNIDEQTRISLFAALGLLPIIAGGVFWLASVDARAQENQARTERIVAKIIKDGDLLLDIRDRLARIEEQLKQRR